MWNWLKRKKEGKENKVNLLAEYIRKAREKGFEDKEIVRKIKSFGYPDDLIEQSFLKELLKGGKMAKKEEFDEEEEFEDEEEEEEEEEEPQKKPKKEVKRLAVGTIRPVYQQVGYEVLKNEEDEKWIPTNSLAEAETLSYIFRK